MAVTADDVKSWYSGYGATPDAAGVDYWVNVANSGGDLSAVQSGFSDSMWGNLNSTPAPAPAPAPAPTPSTSTSSGSAPTPSPAPTPQYSYDDVANWYSGYSQYGVDANEIDQAGVDWWLSQLNSGADLGTVQTDFASSMWENINTGAYGDNPYNQTQAPTQSQDELIGNITNLYTTYFPGREVSDAELQEAMSFIEQNGFDAWNSQFSANAETYNSTLAGVRSIYEALGLSMDDAAGMDYWANAALNAGWTPDELAAAVQQTMINSGTLSPRDVIFDQSQYPSPEGSSYFGVPNELQTSDYVGEFLSQYQPSNMPTTDWNAITQEVQDNMTVQGQLNQLLSEDNPYISRAQVAAMEMANQRGLLNSTLAAQAGQAAAIDAALPIAQQDAQTFFNQGQANQQYQNQAEQYNAETDNSVFKMGYDNSLTMGRMALDAELKEFLDANSDRRDAAIEAGKQVAGINAQFLKSFSEIQQADMATADKDIAIKNLEQSAKQLIGATLGTFEGAGAMGQSAMNSLRATIGAGETISTEIANWFIGSTTGGTDSIGTTAAIGGEPSTWGPPADGESGSRYYGGDEYVYQYGTWRPKSDTLDY